jgi:hypothetical protein
MERELNFKKFSPRRLSAPRSHPPHFGEFLAELHGMHKILQGNENLLKKKL